MHQLSETLWHVPHRWKGSRPKAPNWGPPVPCPILQNLKIWTFSHTIHCEVAKPAFHRHRLALVFDCDYATVTVSLWLCHRDCETAWQCADWGRQTSKWRDTQVIRFVSSESLSHICWTKISAKYSIIAGQKYPQKSFITTTVAGQ